MSSPPHTRNFDGIVVAHTHWDRAWYLPFEVFRHRLVRLIDRLIDLLEENSSFTSFMLDGQTILIEDYLDMRPGNETVLRRLVGEGRLQIGPWYTAPDLFLVTGEAIVRNLQRGLRLSREYGGGMPVGYVPDPFGHVAQMPQILRGLGIDSYLFMRGMSARMKEDPGGIFTWRAPDGSEVLAFYLVDGYFNAAALGHPSIFGRFDGCTVDDEAATRRLRESVERMASLQREGTLLFLNGMDHMPEQPELPALLNRLNDRLPSIRLRQSTLTDFVNAVRLEGHDHGSFEGDLLGNEDHPILRSVLSTRLYLKQQNHAAQSVLLRIAEPMSAWMQAEYPASDARPFLDRAWRELLRNHPHDDICGCSVDDVHRDNEVRFRHVEQLAEAVITEHLETLVGAGIGGREAGEEAHTHVLVFNPHPWPLTHRVRTTILIPDSDERAGPAHPSLPLRGIDGLGEHVPLAVIASEGDRMRSRYLEQTPGRRYDVLMDVDTPPLGYSIVRIAEEKGPEDVSLPPLAVPADFRIRPEDGSIQIHHASGHVIANALAFEYQPDSGDTYSFSPLPGEPVFGSRMVSVEAHPYQPEGLRSLYELRIPASLSSDRMVTLCIQADFWPDPTGCVRLSVRYENIARDGRLRALLGTGIRAEVSRAAGAFRIAEHGREAGLRPEDAPERYAAYPGELPYTTHHHEDVVVVSDDARRIWVADRGLPEYELADDGPLTRVAVTLHRAVGWLSTTGGRIRRCGAGPAIETPEAQCDRWIEAELAIGITSSSVQEAVRGGRAVAHPPLVTELPYLKAPATAGGPKPAHYRSLLEIDNPAFDLTCLKPADTADAIVMRIVNLSSREERGVIRLGMPVSGAFKTDLGETHRKESVTPADGRLQVTLRPGEISTWILLQGPGTPSP
jgi:mannosylglycerate hydrolase